MKKENGVWEQIKSSQELKEVNNYNVQFLEINGDDDEFEEWEEIEVIINHETGQVTITGYPDVDFESLIE